MKRRIVQRLLEIDERMPDAENDSPDQWLDCTENPRETADELFAALCGAWPERTYRIVEIQE